MYLKLNRGFSDWYVILSFPIFGDLGKRSTDLNDTFYCDENLKQSRLYFDKVTSVHWKKNLKEWADDLSKNHSEVVKQEEIRRKGDKGIK
ncbi:MAG: hypothetical protein FWF59_07645 [Turicibacter sp.]|nr:hypothetical protein [Turicibacter sp.]